jgi:hypothetical protein
MRHPELACAYPLLTGGVHSAAALSSMSPARGSLPPLRPIGNAEAFGLHNGSGRLPGMDERSKNPEQPPPCPSCQSTEAVHTTDRYGTRSFFCPSCSHSWDTTPLDSPSTPPKPENS